MTMYSRRFNLAENPFTETPDTNYFFRSRGHQEALKKIIGAVAQGKGFALLSGKIGVGKTLLCRMILKSLRDDVNTSVILHPILNSTEILESICEDFGVTELAAGPTLKDQLDRLTNFLISSAEARRRCLLIIDDAQSLAPEVLETIRILSNLETEREKLLQIILVGQPQLETILKAPNLEQLYQRLSVSAHLAPLPVADVGAYLQHRIAHGGGGNFLRFQPKAVELLHKISGGVPRLINRYAEAALRMAETQGLHLIEAELMRRSLEVVGALPVRRSLFRRRGSTEGGVDL